MCGTERPLPAEVRLALYRTAQEAPFLQPYLQQRYSRLVSALIVGVLWGTWHVMYLSDGPVFFALFLVLTITFSVIMAELIRSVAIGFTAAAILVKAATALRARATTETAGGNLAG